MIGLGLISLLALVGLTHAGSPWHNSNCAENRVAIVHLFEWKWSDIAAECERFLGPRGFCGVQLSPSHEHAVVTSDAMRPWWERYQPIGYSFNSRSGTEAQFADMVKRCNNAKVRIYVDGVINHMAGLGRVGPGSGGSNFDSDRFDFPAVPFQAEHFTPRSKCSSGSGMIENYGDPEQVRNCMLVGLTDLDQSNEYTREKIVGYLNKAIDYGVAGFRIDAAKHMWPADMEVIQNRMNNLNTQWFPSGSKAFMFHEVIDMSNEPITGQDYAHLGRVTDFRYCIKIRETVDSPWNLRSVYDPGWGMLPPEDAFVFVDNHDNQRGHGASGNVITFRDPARYKRAVGFTLANDYGYPRIMSSYFFKDGDDSAGPPHNPDYSIADVPINSDGSCGGDWVCEHRWPAIAGFVSFSKAVAGTYVENWQSADGCGAFTRGNKGFAIFCTQAGLSGEFFTNLPAGRYCNVVSGFPTDSGCSGQVVDVDGSGNANIQLKDSANTLLAIHVEAMFGSGDSVPTGVPPTAGTPGNTPNTPPTLTPPPSTTRDPATEDWMRTVVFIEKTTSPGQDVFLRGGISYDMRPSCGTGSLATDPCATPMLHNTIGTNLHYEGYNAWKEGDNFLDWRGGEVGQGSYLGQTPSGTPTVWTSNQGGNPGYNVLNTYGDHYWMVDVEMDCSRTENGWFEIKGFVTNGDGWERDITQTSTCLGSVGGSRPFSSGNHFGRCGYVNVFQWNNGLCVIENFP